jgi:leucyl aminopeptidase
MSSGHRRPFDFRDPAIDSDTMNTTQLRQPIATVKTQWLVLGVFENEANTVQELEGTGAGATVERLRSDKDMTGTLGELTVLHEPRGLEAGAMVLVGLGPRARFDAGAAYSAGFTASKRLAGKGRESVAFVLPPSEDPRSVASAMIEGAVAGTRSSGLRKFEPNRHAFGTLSLVIPPSCPEDLATSLESSIRRGQIVGAAVNLARDLVNTPPSEKSPIKLAERIGLVATDAGIAVETWDEHRIEHERFGGLLGVAAGSDEPPRFLILDYRRGHHSPTIALVGKGVTFDSGGLCLKPAASMEDMKADMTGAAVVAAAMHAIARLDLPVNLTGYLALTENMTGGRAMKLGDVLTIRNGKTVEILNTDAEGRLILADALSYAVERRPQCVLDLATLTGSCMVALGTKVAGLFSNDAPFAEDFLAASRQTGERVWRLPLDDDYKEQLKSHVADLKNVGGKWGGAITAAKFLEHFVGSTPWIHLDIAGPSWSDTDSSTHDVGATGCFVRTLIQLVENVAKSQTSDART